MEHLKYQYFKIHEPKICVIDVNSEKLMKLTIDHVNYCSSLNQHNLQFQGEGLYIFELPKISWDEPNNNYRAMWSYVEGTFPKNVDCCVMGSWWDEECTKIGWLPHVQNISCINYPPPNLQIDPFKQIDVYGPYRSYIILAFIEKKQDGELVYVDPDKEWVIKLRSEKHTIM